MSSDLAIFILVVAIRFLVPLAIFRFPLPAIFISLVVDAADQTVFQNFTDLDLTNYQGYDKALDIFYLTIAYISVFRNWRHPVAITVAAFLWYYRLVGVTLFEMTEWRPLLLIFPNTFEYFFIFMEIVRLQWDSARLSRRQVLGAAAAIWIFIKLPQEWWIHIAKLDFTDFMKEDLLGASGTDSWGTAFANRPLVTALIIALVAAAIGIAVTVWRRLPSADYPITIDSDRVSSVIPDDSPPARGWTDGLIEKIALISMILIIFTKAIPGSTASVTEQIITVVIILAANAALSQWLFRFERYERAWSTTAGAFGATLAVNSFIWIVATQLLSTDDRDASLAATAFFLLLLSLIIALFDRYRPGRRMSGLNREIPAVP